jgi:hypothetical protein
MPSLCFTVFSAAFTLLIFEISLVRVFSIAFSYHYASLIVSLSMLGIVFGALLAHRKIEQGCASPAGLDVVRLALAAAYTAPPLIGLLVPFDYYRMIWEPRQALYLLCHLLVVTLPFLLYAMIFTWALAAARGRTEVLYAADLAGAGLGGLAALGLLNLLPAGRAAPFLSAVLFASLIPRTGRPAVRTVAVLGFLSTGAVAALNLLPAAMSPYKPLMQALKEDRSHLVETVQTAHSRLDLFENPRMRTAPGLSLGFAGAVPSGLGLALDGDVAGVLLDPAGVAGYTFLDNVPACLPFLLANRRTVVVAGLRNSSEILLPYRYGASKVHIVENDRSIIAMAQKRYGAESPYRRDLQPVFLRRFLETTTERFDLILLARTGYFPSAAFGLQEDYDVTVEAIGQMLNRMNDGGALLLQTFLLPPPRHEIRLFNNIVTALRKGRFGPPQDHLLAYRTWDTISFLVTPSPITEGERRTAEAFLNDNGFDLLFPRRDGAKPFITGTDYEAVFSAAVDPSVGVHRQAAYLFDVRTTTDDRPFFHYFLKATRIPEVLRLAGGKWLYFLYEGMALPFLLPLLAAMALVPVAATFTATGGPFSGPTSRARLWGYFSAIGIAFMFVEISFIHRAVLSFGNPLTAFAAVIVTLLVSSGAGSLISTGLSGRSLKLVMWSAPFLLPLYAVFFPPGTAPIPVLAVLVPVGFAMGCFFPRGMKVLCVNNGSIMAIAYAVNGAASVLAPIVASLTALQTGHRFLLVAAAFLYTCALLLLGPTCHGYKGNGA